MAQATLSSHHFPVTQQLPHKPPTSATYLNSNRSTRRKEIPISNPSMAAPVKNNGSNGYKGHGGGGGGGGGRQYGLMLLVALGAAILGVTVLHKLREGRLFSLLVKEKDHELLSLHLLLQREHEFSKEAQKKLQEMKTNLYSVKAQKSDVEGRLMEVRSLVSSLKDEQKILESQLEEKRSEIKRLRQQQMMPNEEIRETSNQKEGETDEPKSHIERPASVWSVSSDDPSNPNINSQGSSDDRVGSVYEGTDGSKNETNTESKQEERKLEDTSEEGQMLRDEPKQSEDGKEQRMMTGSDVSGSGIRVMNSKQRRLRRKNWRNYVRRFRGGKYGHLVQNEALSARKKNHAESYISTGASGQKGRDQDGYVENSSKDESSAQHGQLPLSMSKEGDEKGTDSSLKDNAEMKEHIAEPDPDSSLDDNAEMKERHIVEPDPDSSLKDNADMKERHVAEPDPDSSLKVNNADTKERHVAEPNPDSSLNQNTEMKERHIAEPDPDSSLKDNAEMKQRHIAEPDPDSSLKDNAEMKERHTAEPDPDSSLNDNADSKERHIAEPDPDSSLNHNAEMKERHIAEPDPDSSLNHNAEMKERHIAEPDPDSSLNDNADVKERHIAEPDPDSSDEEAEVDSILEEDSEEIDQGSDHVEAEEETDSSKDDELEHETR